jgi:phosphohistidine phosphatase
MKTWVMMRHAKSSWAFDLPDRERPLAERGVRDASLVGERLNTMNFKFDKVCSSPAKRAFDTALLVTSSLGIDSSTIEIEEELYDFSGNQVLNFIRSQEESLSNIITFGHNNACLFLAKTLGRYNFDNVPTATAVIFRFDVSLWNQITDCRCSAIIPKEIR